MATESPSDTKKTSRNVSGNAPSNETQEFLLRILILSLIYVLAMACRLYSILRYESVIHEFDPYFNFRTTKVFVNEGIYNFWNWFDDISWYPLGRIVGGTVYPGLMLTAGTIHNVLHALNLPVDIRNICVLTAPWFSSNTAIVTYFLTSRGYNRGAGLVAAAFMSIVPGYISRSVAGSFDNEGIAIFALLLTFYLWTKSVTTGSILWSTLASLALFYMISAWGGYVFIINLIPLYVLVSIFAGRYSVRLYIAYSTFYVLGTLLAMQITFVGFQAVQSSEHMAFFGVFAFLQIYAFFHFVKSKLSAQRFKTFQMLSVTVLVVIVSAAAVIVTASGFRSPWTGRFWSMFDPTYAKIHIPIIASVSEHQPTTWSTYMFDLHILIFLFPVGLFLCFKKITDVRLFFICYGVTAVYFSGIMVRLMLVLTPIVCVLSGIAVSEFLNIYVGAFKDSRNRQVSKDIGFVATTTMFVMLVMFSLHCNWISAEAYSSPSIVLQGGPRNNPVIFDDFREAYRWLNQNTAPDAKIMSWWDYGYQLTAMANRTTLVDNNTWNNTHISQVGKAFASNERAAYHLLRKFDTDYVLVIFGGMTGYSGDDINKFLWMVRIAGSTDPSISERAFYTKSGEFKVDDAASEALVNSLMYKVSYYRFNKIRNDPKHTVGFDRVRNVPINRDIRLAYFEEVYTTEHWLVRIYKLKEPTNRKTLL